MLTDQEHLQTAFTMPASSKPRAGDRPFALVSMPFASLRRPSIQLGLLKAIGDTHGFQVQTHHLYLDFVDVIGAELYELLTQYRGRMIGDWIFGRAAFGDDDPDPDAKFVEVFGEELTPFLKLVETDVDRILELRNEKLPETINEVARRVDWDSYAAVGFTSTFQQNAASIALARKIKELSPSVSTLFGGANFEDEMGRELVRTVPWIDYAVSGEADSAFPACLQAIRDGHDMAVIPGVISRSENSVVATPVEPPFENMNSLPVPNYDEYFERVSQLGLLKGQGRRRIMLPFEASRGCWWGEEHHCTFCGLNGTTMSYRSKSPESVLRELGELAERYHSFDFEAVDNIMDMRLIDDLFDHIAKQELDYQFFFEVKSNLTRAQIRKLAAGGVRWVQPGIESVNSDVLKLMRKGVTAAQNVNALRWFSYYGVHVNWNLLWGFPGETPEQYNSQLALIRNIRHLPPPDAVGRVWMERFSPIFRDREAFPMKGTASPEPSYAFVYPKTIRTDRIAYFFDYELENTPSKDVYIDTVSETKVWGEAWKEEVKPMLVHRRAGRLVYIEDRRDAEEPKNWAFTPPLSNLFIACNERPVTAEKVRRVVGLDWPLDKVEEALDQFCQRGLMMRDGDRFLCLSVPAQYRA